MHKIGRFLLLDLYLSVIGAWRSLLWYWEFTVSIFQFRNIYDAKWIRMLLDNYSKYGIIWLKCLYNALRVKIEQNMFVPMAYFFWTNFLKNLLQIKLFLWLLLYWNREWAGDPRTHYTIESSESPNYRAKHSRCQG